MRFYYISAKFSLGDTMTTQPPADLVERFQQYDAAWNEGDLDAVDDLFADSVRVYDVPAGTTYDGRDAFKEWITDIREGFPDFTASFADSDVIVGDGKVAVEWEMSGTHEGHLPGLDIEPTHEAVEFSGVTVYELDGETVTEARWYYDMLALLSQVGAAPEELPA